MTRTHGGLPVLRKDCPDHVEAPPHTRGSTSMTLGPGRGLSVYPARAGVNRRSEGDPRSRRCLPPHARGSTGDRLRSVMGPRVCPARARVNRLEPVPVFGVCRVPRHCGGSTAALPGARVN